MDGLETHIHTNCVNLFIDMMMMHKSQMNEYLNMPECTAGSPFSEDFYFTFQVV